MTRKAAALLAAIAADPDDLAARAVYADHLLEAGDPRGEFIHVQCKLAGTPAGVAKVAMTATDALRAREAALLKKHEAAWLAPLKAIVKRATFARGFPEVIEIDAAKLVANAAALRRVTPVADLTIRGVTEAIAGKLAACPLLAETPAISFAGAHMTAKIAAQLFARARFTRARALSFADNYLQDAAQVALGRALATAPALRMLDLDETNFSTEGVVALAASGVRLSHLTLARNPLVSGWAMEELAPQPMLATIRDLNLYACNLQVSVRQLAESPHLAALERLVIHKNKIPTAAARALLDAADAGKFPKLAEVWIHDNDVAQKVAATFAKRFPRGGVG